MKLTESEIRTLIREEVRLQLLVEEVQAEILNEGIVRWLKKTFGQSSWEDLVGLVPRLDQIWLQESL